jgi:uncharacterized DUF497 family protein
MLYIPIDGSVLMPDFEWDAAKDRANRSKHGIGFELAQHAFQDPLRVIKTTSIMAARSSGTSVLAGRGGHHDGALYVAKPEDQDFRRRLLAERKGDL